MASVLAREAAALRRRRESLPTALHPAPSAQAPRAGAPGAGAGPAVRGLPRALSPAPTTAGHAHASRSPAAVRAPGLLTSLSCARAPG